MTREEAIKTFEDILQLSPTLDETGCSVTEAMKVALTSLRHQIWEDQLWHNAKTDPPKTPGLYYGKKDDTNSMYACRYRDSVWVLDAYPQQKMDIVQWADYAAFARENEETALRPVSREQVEKVWRGCEKCNGAGEYSRYAENLTKILLAKYCPHCGRPLTDEAVEMVMERMEALYEKTD